MEGEDISKARDKGIIKRTREAGEGFDHPNVCKILFQRRSFVLQSQKGDVHALINNTLIYRMEVW